MNIIPSQCEKGDNYIKTSMCAENKYIASLRYTLAYMVVVWFAILQARVRILAQHPLKVPPTKTAAFMEQ
jgi:hypothetical protein